jgi:enoyl-CoA hydratase
MSDLATYSRSGPVASIVMDDGKANVMSLSMLNALHAAFDQAEKDKTVVILKARGKHFSGGFDLNVFAKGSAEDQYLMLKAGAELALRILSFPTPVVAACQGNAYPMGAFLIMSSDHRIAAEGDYRIGMNEVAIGLTVPRFAIEVARQRLTPAYFSRVVMTAEMFGPAEAVTAGFCDRVVPSDQLEKAADETAQALSKLNMAAHAATKARARGVAISLIRQVIDEDITPQYGEDRVARRASA